MNQRSIKLAAAGLLTICSIGSAQAQDQTDALRFSFLQPQGTARSIGFGNTLGSVGGDFTALSVNPAGIGIYRKSEVVFSPSMMFNNVDGTYLGNKQSDNGQHFAISNFGAVFTHAARGRHYDQSNWKSFSFAIGMNRMADFTRDYTYQGNNTTSSGSWVFENDANRYPGDIDQPNSGSPGYLGYQSYLLDTTTFSNGDKGYRSVINPSATDPVGQRMNVKERGGISEFLLSWGGNYQEKLMLGATVGIPVVRYVRESTYKEYDLSGDPNNSFDNYVYTDNLRTTGVGINAKLGFIYKPIEYFRFGGAIHTPTYIGLHDRQERGIVANTENFGGIRSVGVPDNTYDYSLTTPWKAVASATALFGPYGFITVDYEYVDYSSSRFNFDGADRDYETYVNDQIKSSYRGASNIRAGIELKFDFLSLRGGFGYYGNPYDDKVYKDGERYDFSGGIGFRMRHSFIDLGFVHHQFKNTEQPYTVPYAGIMTPTAALKTNQTNAVLSFGWKF